MILKHKSGYVTCHLPKLASTKSNWGCDKNNVLKTLVTNNYNKIIFPSVEHTINKFANNMVYFLPGFAGYLDTLVFATDFVAKPKFMNKGQELRIWYGEDLVNVYESDNGGTQCVEVVSKILQYEYYKE